MDMADLNEFFSAAKGALDVFRGVKELLPDGAGAEDAQKQIELAEEALQASKAKLAQSLNYHLCQCTFPPQIMLSEGYHDKHDAEVFRCPKCKKQEPSEYYFREMDEVDEYNAGLGRNPVTGY
jgi:hypothetical protein